MELFDRLGDPGKLRLHPGAKRLISENLEEIRRGAFHLLKDRRVMPALALLEEVSRTGVGAHSPGWQERKWRELNARMKHLQLNNLRVFSEQPYRDALSRAFNHPEFRVTDIEAFGNFLRETAHAGFQPGKGLGGFPRRSVQAYMLLKAEPGFDISTQQGEHRYREALKHLGNAHANLWDWFSSSPENFVLSVKLAAKGPGRSISETRKAERVRRSLRNLGLIGLTERLMAEGMRNAPEGRYVRKGLEFEERESPRALWNKVLKHPNLPDYLRKNFKIPNTKVVRRMRRHALGRLEDGELSRFDLRAIYAWGLKAASGEKQVSRGPERSWLKKFDSRMLDGPLLEKLLRALDGMGTQKKD